MAKGLLLNYFFCEGCGICAMWPHDSDLWKISYLYCSELEGVDRTRELPCLARGLEVWGVDRCEKVAEGAEITCSFGAFGGSLLVGLGLGGDW